MGMAWTAKRSLVSPFQIRSGIFAVLVIVAEEIQEHGLKSNHNHEVVITNLVFKQDPYSSFAFARTSNGRQRGYGCRKWSLYTIHRRS